jgi:hypothetical protein
VQEEERTTVYDKNIPFPARWVRIEKHPSSFLIDLKLNLETKKFLKILLFGFIKKTWTYLQAWPSSPLCFLGLLALLLTRWKNHKLAPAPHTASAYCNVQ